MPFPARTGPAHRPPRARVPRVLALLVAAAAGLLNGTPAAHAAFRAPCTPGASSGPTCTWWNARATFVADGDTIDARVDGRVRHIRLVGINAMELTRYSSFPSRRRGACHGLEAAALVDRAIRRSGGRIRLAAQDPRSRSGSRLRRSVWVGSGGRWHDLARMQLAAGLALWLPNRDERAHDRDYAALASRAIAAQRALYEPDGCGAGPDADLRPSLAVNWDADGNDEANVNGEWADIRNGGSRPMRLAGWRFRDSALRSYRFPRAAVVPAGGSLRLRMGCGTDTAGELHWCQRRSVFENAGDGGYLFDPRGNVRASFLFPCVVDCADPLQAAVRLAVRPGAPESIMIKNVGNAPIDLADRTLKLRNGGRAGTFVFGIVFRPGSIVQPGQARTVTPADAGRGPHALADRGGVVELRTLTDVPTACAAWGFGRC